MFIYITTKHSIRVCWFIYLIHITAKLFLSPENTQLVKYRYPHLALFCLTLISPLLFKPSFLIYSLLYLLNCIYYSHTIISIKSSLNTLFKIHSYFFYFLLSLLSFLNIRNTDFPPLNYLY